MHSGYHITLRNRSRHLLPGGGGKTGMPPLLLALFPVPEDPTSDTPPDLLLFPGIEIENVCPSFNE
jgi:hypothetical protein